MKRKRFSRLLFLMLTIMITVTFYQPAQAASGKYTGTYTKTWSVSSNMKSQKLRLSLQKYRHFAIIKPVTEPCHVQHRGIQSGKDTLFFQGIPFVETACRNQQPVI